MGTKRVAVRSEGESLLNVKRAQAKLLLTLMDINIRHSNILCVPAVRQPQSELHFSGSACLKLMEIPVVIFPGIAVKVPHDIVAESKNVLPEG